jgi:hypothetical protein
VKNELEMCGKKQSWGNVRNYEYFNIFLERKRKTSGYPVYLKPGRLEYYAVVQST